MTETTVLVIESEESLGQFLNTSVESLLSNEGERDVSVEETTKGQITVDRLDELKEEYMLGSDEFADISQTIHYLITKDLD
jgi:esterase/lipase superfamily enzyme